MAGLALAGAGCGSTAEEEPDPGRGLPQSFVDALEPRLEEVQRRYDDGVDNGNPGSCKDIAGDSFAGSPGEPGIDEILAGLPQDVDPDLRRAVERSVENLRTLTEDCVEQAEAAAPEPEPEPVPVAPEPEEPTPETTPDEEAEKDDEGNGDDGGGEQPAPTPTPEPAPEPQQPELVPPGQGGGVPAPAPRGQQGTKKDKPSNGKGR